MRFFQHLSGARFVSTILSVQVLANLAAAANTCSNDEPPQPIGIDFAQDVITAAYAHAVDNVTFLAAVTAIDDERYSHHIFRLRLEDYQQRNLSTLFASKEPPETIFQLMFAIGRHYLSNLSTSIQFLDHPAIIAIRDSTVLDWIRDISNRICSVAKPLLAATSTQWPDEMTPENIRDGFVSGLKLLKERALISYDINITFAILSVPDFFNETINDVVKKACQAVGIETIKPLSRTVMGAWGAKTAPDARVLVVDQGKFHLGLRTYQEVRSYGKPISQQYLPLDRFGSAGIDLQLVARVIGSNDVLREQIKLGADRQKLLLAIKRARLLIKDNLDVLMGKSAEGYHEEWPLDLKDWWIGEEQNAVLLWEEVEVEEEKYVEQLSDTIFKFLVSLRMRRENSKDEESTPPEDIDVAVIMTNHGDGDLLKRAVNKALGREVEIMGGAISDVMFAADGAAIAAFKRLESWQKMQAYRQYEEEFKHGEL